MDAHDDYHARLAAHLESLLTTHLHSLAAATAPASMVTDLKALRERDREHQTAWRTEGYARYVGGAGTFELKGEVGTRKRRYTEEPGLLTRRRGALLAGVGEGSALSDDEERERDVKRQRMDRGTSRGRDPVADPSPGTGTRRTVSAGPQTPETPTAVPEPTHDQQRHITPDLAFIPPPLHPQPSPHRVFTLQQPPAPRRPFRRPLQPQNVTHPTEDANTSQTSVLLASQHLVPRLEQDEDEAHAAAQAKAIGTSLSASSALSAFVHQQHQQHQHHQQHQQQQRQEPPQHGHAPMIAVACAASPSIGSLTSASLGCARAALLTPLVGTSQGDPAATTPIAKPSPATQEREDANRDSVQVGTRTDDEDIWACFMQLEEMGTPVGGRPGQDARPS